MQNLLLITNNGENCSYKKRLNFEDQIDWIRSERAEKMQQIEARELLIDQLRKETTEMKDEID